MSWKTIDEREAKAKFKPVPAGWSTAKDIAEQRGVITRSMQPRIEAWLRLGLVERKYWMMPGANGRGMKVAIYREKQ